MSRLHSFWNEDCTFCEAREQVEPRAPPSASWGVLLLLLNAVVFPLASAAQRSKIHIMTAGYGHLDSLGVRTYFEAHSSTRLRFVTSLVPRSQRAVYTRSDIGSTVW